MRRSSYVLVLPLLLALLLVASCGLIGGMTSTRSYAVAPRAVPAFPPSDVTATDNLSTTPLRTDVVTIMPTNVSYHVEIADTADSRNLGLMRRPSLAQDAGMLFVFDSQQTRYFWMKDTLIPLDILFIAKDGAIVDIQTMQPCTTNVCDTYLSRAPAKFALEINAGEAKKNGIAVGQTVVLPS